MLLKKRAKYRNTSTEKIRSAYLKQTSLKTFIDVEEVIGMLVYLISLEVYLEKETCNMLRWAEFADNSYKKKALAKKITGQMLVIDGNTESLSIKGID